MNAPNASNAFNAFTNVNDLWKKTDHWGWVEGLYLAKNDDGIALRIFNGFPYEPESRKLWRSLCKDAGVVIDIGAHTGVYSLDAHKSGAKQVLSIEPNPLNYARLVMNLRHAGFESTNAVLCAVGEENGLCYLSTNCAPGYCTAGGKVTERIPTSVQYPVFIRRLDKLLIPSLYEKVAVVKIDTEKHGLSVLKGMPAILAHKPDLILECTEEGLGEFLKPLGYHFYLIDEKKGLSLVDDLIPENPFHFDRPNRYATMKVL